MLAGWYYATDYLNRQDVRDALHIKTSQAFEFCNNAIHSHYQVQKRGSIWIYKAMRRMNYKMLFFSGDTDGIVPTLGSQRWIKSLKWKNTGKWKTWHTDKEFSGMKAKYENLDFVTVHGVGHMSPQWARPAVTHMITSWIHDIEF